MILCSELTNMIKETILIAQLAGAIKYTDYTSAEG